MAEIAVLASLLGVGTIALQVLALPQASDIFPDMPFKTDIIHEKTLIFSRYSLAALAAEINLLVSLINCAKSIVKHNTKTEVRRKLANEGVATLFLQDTAVELLLCPKCPSRTQHEPTGADEWSGCFAQLMASQYIQQWASFPNSADIANRRYGDSSIT
ncbi:hypothetical protein BX666DRAFT_705513 [Dichotomocladium elegans]|nr:hypothetical protein BX666DRAFT_705513 [Dichotomocladium elegans]